MEIESIEIEALTPDPNNARTHDENNIAAIKGSLTQFGQRKPIVISQNNIVVAGNGTMQAAKELGWKNISAVRVPAEWTQTQITAFALADNRTAELASWRAEKLDEQLLDLELSDFNLTAIGFNVNHDYEDADWSNLENAVKPKADFQQMTFVLSDAQADLVHQAIAKAKLQKPIGDGINQNSNGNALHLIVESFLKS